MSATTLEEQIKTQPHTEVLESVTIRFAGDSGDGMQVTGTQFTSTAAIFGNAISAAATSALRVTNLMSWSR
jgi:hypothetical protein